MIRAWLRLLRPFRAVPLLWPVLICVGVLAALGDALAAERRVTPADGPLQALIDAAAPGDVLHLAPGEYAGGVRIAKPLALLGEPGAVIDGGGRGDVVRVTAPDVVLAHLTLRRSGHDTRNPSRISANPSPYSWCNSIINIGTRCDTSGTSSFKIEYRGYPATISDSFAPRSCIKLKIASMLAIPSYTNRNCGIMIAPVPSPATAICSGR